MLIRMLLRISLECGTRKWSTTRRRTKASSVVEARCLILGSSLHRVLSWLLMLDLVFACASTSSECRQARTDADLLCSSVMVGFALRGSLGCGGCHRSVTPDNFNTYRLSHGIPILCKIGAPSLATAVIGATRSSRMVRCSGS